MTQSLSTASGARLAFDGGLVVVDTDAGTASSTEPVIVERWSTEGSARRDGAAYSHLETVGEAVVARASLPVGGALVHVTDRWTVAEPGFRLERGVRVEGDAEGGFLTEVGFELPPAQGWDDVDIFVPGMLYGDPDLINPEAIGGRRWLDEGVTEMRIRADRMPAPLLAVRLRDGTSVALLDAEPDCATTFADAADVEAVPLVESGLRFGALALTATPDGLRLAYSFPGTEGEVTYRGDTFPDGQARQWRRRYHPLCDGLTQRYVAEIRPGADEPFSELVRGSWRWAWDRLGPRVAYQDIEAARGALVEQLTSAAVEIEGRTGVPTRRHLLTAEIPDGRPGAWRTVLGFTGRGAECGWYLLHEAEHEAERAGSADRYRALGTAILDTLVALPVAPPAGTGIDLRTGETVAATPRSAEAGLVRLRVLAEGGKAMARAWRFEHDHGREHPAWLAWSRELAGWLLRHQGTDGSFPRAWAAGSDTVADPSPRSSYNAIPFLAEMHRVTGERRYLDAALRTGGYCWASGHADGVFAGGTLDNPDVVDKEAGTVALEGYLALFEATREPRWLDCAQAAADFAETWIYLWDVPMPPGDDSERGWKNGVPTTGVQLIASGHSLVDQYMAWDAPSYARLAEYTGDDHYLDVARLLLHNTKTMLALPGRCYDLAGPGWQQEHWSLAPRRGEGIHRAWLPWVTCSHIESIVGIEDHNPELLQRLSEGL